MNIWSSSRFHKNRKIEETELNKNSLDIIINGWSMQAYVQVFDSEVVSFKEAIDSFERM